MNLQDRLSASQQRTEQRRQELLARQEEQKAEKQRAKDARENPTDRELEIRAQIKDLMGTGLSVRKEVRYLPDIMEPDETVKGTARGVMDGKTWLVVCTDRRVIFVDKGLVFGLRQMEIPLEAITSVSHRTKMVLGWFEILGAGLSGMKVDNVDKDTVVKFARAVQEARREFTT